MYKATFNILGSWQYHKRVTVHTGCENMYKEVHSYTKDAGYYRYFLMYNVKKIHQPQGLKINRIRRTGAEFAAYVRGKVRRDFLFTIICLTREINRTSTTKRVRMQPVNLHQQIKKNMWKLPPKTCGIPERFPFISQLTNHNPAPRLEIFHGIERKCATFRLLIINIIIISLARTGPLIHYTRRSPTKCKIQSNQM